MLIFIKGSDSFLAQEAILAIKKKYLEKNPDGVELIEINPDSLNGKGGVYPVYPELSRGERSRGVSPTSPEGLRGVNWADLRAVPLFATSRLIIIKHAGELLVGEQDSLASILTDLPTTSVVVIWDSKPLKATSALSHICDKALKKITAEPLAGSALTSWIKAQANKLGLDVSAEVMTELVDQYGTDLWAISTDLKTRSGGTGPSSWGRATITKPFALFDYVRGRQWPDLRRHLVKSFERGEAVEMIIGSLAAAVRKNVASPELKLKMTNALSEIDLALKTGLVEPGDAIALLVYYLPDVQKRVQWENQYYANY